MVYPTGFHEILCRICIYVYTVNAYVCILWDIGYIAHSPSVSVKHKDLKKTVGECFMAIIMVCNTHDDSNV